MTKSTELCQDKRPRERAAVGATCVCLSPAKRLSLQGTHTVGHWACRSQGQAEALKEKGGKEEQLLVVIGWPRAALSASCCVSAAIGDVSTPHGLKCSGWESNPI